MKLVMAETESRACFSMQSFVKSDYMHITRGCSIAAHANPLQSTNLLKWIILHPYWMVIIIIIINASLQKSNMGH